MKFSEDEKQAVIELAFEVLGKQLLSLTAPKDWTKMFSNEGEKDESLVDYTVKIPKVVMDNIISKPGGNKAFDLFVSMSIMYTLTDLAKSYIEGAEKKKKTEGNVVSMKSKSIH